MIEKCYSPSLASTRESLTAQESAMVNEVEPEIWKAARRATQRYFRGIMHLCNISEQTLYRTGYIMGYRAGLRLGAKRSRN